MFKFIFSIPVSLERAIYSLLFLFGISSAALSQPCVFTDDFSDDAGAGYTATPGVSPFFSVTPSTSSGGASNWTAVILGTPTAQTRCEADQYVQVVGGAIEFSDTKFTGVVANVDSVDITCFENLEFCLDVDTRGTFEDTDFLSIEYRIDGGAPQSLVMQMGAAITAGQICQTIPVEGSTFDYIIRANVCEDPIMAYVTPTHDFVADLETDGDDYWNDQIAGGGDPRWGPPDTGTAPARIPVCSDGTCICYAYDLVGAAAGNTANGGSSGFRLDHNNVGTGANDSWADGNLGDYNEEDVTIEMWFRPDVLPQTPANVVLFEDGGFLGMGLFLEGNNLVLRQSPGGGMVAFNIAALVAAGDFIQATFTFSLGPDPDVIELFVNGASVGTANTGNINNWSGGDGAGLGMVGALNNGGVGSGDAGYGSFDGQLANFRLYNNTILTPAQVLQNYEALTTCDDEAIRIDNLCLSGVYGCCPPVEVTSVATVGAGACGMVTFDYTMVNTSSVMLTGVTYRTSGCRQLTAAETGLATNDLMPGDTLTFQCVRCVSTDLRCSGGELIDQGIVANAFEACPLLPFSASIPASSGQIGTVYEDLNYDGAFSDGEPTISGVTITAYDCDNIAVATATSGDCGCFELNISLGAEVRIEFDNLPAGYCPAPSACNLNEKDSISQVTKGIGGSLPCKMDFGLTTCGPAPDCSQARIYTACFILDNQPDEAAVMAQPVMGCVDYGTRSDLGQYNTDNNVPPFTNVMHTYLAGTVGSQGAVWGVAYDAINGKVYSSAGVMRKNNFGPGGAGTIYCDDVGAGTITPLLNLDDFGISDGDCADDRSPDFINGIGDDPEGVTGVGRCAFGDIEISPDGNTLYAVNLGTGELLVIDLTAWNASGAAITAADIIRIPVPDPGCFDSTAGVAAPQDNRPWALAVWNGKVYVGTVCSAETSQDANDLSMTVWEMDPSSFSFSNFFTEPFAGIQKGYPDRYFDATSEPCGSWYPWTDDWSKYNQFTSRQGNQCHACYPQPMLSDIEFTEEGGMVLGLSDRMSFQWRTAPGHFIHIDGSNLTPPAPNPFCAGENRFSIQIPAGQFLYAYNDNCTYVLENNARLLDAAGNVVRTAADTDGWIFQNQGPAPMNGVAIGPYDFGPGGFPFFHDAGAFDHGDAGAGAMAYLPKQDEVLFSMADPNVFNSGGFRYASWIDGSWQGGYTFSGTRNLNMNNPPPPSVGASKSLAFGDIETGCPLGKAMVEIGSRLWLDCDKDGIQDPCDDECDATGLASIEVQLWDQATATYITNTFTDANGHYFFSSSITTQLLAGTIYEIRIPLGQGRLSCLTGTTPNYAGDADNSDLHDSDGVVVGNDLVAVVDTGVCCVQPAVDFGFVYACAPPLACTGTVEVDLGCIYNTNILSLLIPPMDTNLTEELCFTFEYGVYEEVLAVTGCTYTLCRSYSASNICATNPADMVSSCTQKYTWTTDREPPKVTCPAGRSLGCMTNLTVTPNTVIAFVAAQAPLACDLDAVRVVESCSECEPEVCLWCDTYTTNGCQIVLDRKIRVTDCCGNVGSCTITYTINDVPPTITGVQTGGYLGCVTSIPTNLFISVTNLPFPSEETGESGTFAGTVDAELANAGSLKLDDPTNDVTACYTTQIMPCDDLVGWGKISLEHDLPEGAVISYDVSFAGGTPVNATVTGPVSKAVAMDLSSFVTDAPLDLKVTFVRGTNLTEEVPADCLETNSVAADARIQSLGPNANNNYGSFTPLKVEANTKPEENYKSYLRFDLSALDFPVDQYCGATLCMPRNNDSNGVAHVYAIADGATDTVWNESTITWNNAPANANGPSGLSTDAVFLGTYSGTAKLSQDVLSALVSDLNGTLTFILVGDAASSPATEVWFNNRETGNGAELILTPCACEALPVTNFVSGCFLGWNATYQCGVDPNTLTTADLISTGLVTVTTNSYTNDVSCEITVERVYRVASCCDLFDEETVTYTYTKLPSLTVGPLAKLDVGCIASTNQIPPVDLTMLAAQSDCSIVSIQKVAPSVTLLEEDYEGSSIVMDAGNANVTVSTAPDPHPSGSNGTVATVDHSVNGLTFGEARPLVRNIELPACVVPGAAFSFCVDYFVPGDSGLTNGSPNPDVLAVLLRFNDGVEIPSISQTFTGSVNLNTATTGSWFTICATGMVPPFDQAGNPVSHVAPIISFQDQDPDVTFTGIDLYFDNVDLTFDASPIPVRVDECTWSQCRTFEVETLCGVTETVTQDVCFQLNTNSPEIVSLPKGSNHFCQAADYCPPFDTNLIVALVNGMPWDSVPGSTPLLGWYAEDYSGSGVWAKRDGAASNPDLTPGAGSGALAPICSPGDQILVGGSQAVCVAGNGFTYNDFGVNGGAELDADTLDSRNDATWEICFAADALPTPARQTIIDTGGNGNGTGIDLNGNLLTLWGRRGGTSFPTPPIDLSTLGVGQGDFVCAVVHIDFNLAAGNQTITLTATAGNGQSATVSQTINNLTPWADADDGGLGVVNGSFADASNPVGLVGKIARLRLWANIEPINQRLSVDETRMTNDCEVMVMREYRLEDCCGNFDRRSTVDTFTVEPGPTTVEALAHLDLGCISTLDLIPPPSEMLVNASSDCNIASITWCGDTPIDDPVADFTWQAEDMLLGGRFEAIADPTAQGGFYITATNLAAAATFDATPSMNNARITVNIAKAGTYRLSALVRREAAGNGQAETDNNSFWVQVDNLPAAGSPWDLGGNATGWTSDFVNGGNVATDPLLIPLSPGPHLFTLSMREDGAQVDEFTLEFVSADDPLTCECASFLARCYEVVNACGATSTVTQTISYVLDTAPPRITSVPPYQHYDCVTNDPQVVDYDTIVVEDDGNYTNVMLAMEMRIQNGCDVTVTRTWRVEDCCGGWDQKDEVYSYTLQPTGIVFTAVPSDVELGCINHSNQVPPAVPSLLKAEALATNFCSTIVLSPIDDAFIRAGNNANTPQGGGIGMFVEAKNATGDNRRKGYYRFDLSTVPPGYSAATLQLTQTDANPDRNFNLYALNDGPNDVWDETTLVWSGAPANASGLTTSPDLGTFTTLTPMNFGGNGGGIAYQFDALAPVNANMVNPWVTFVVAETTIITPGKGSFASKENTTIANRPQLILEYCAPNTNACPVQVMHVGDTVKSNSLNGCVTYIQREYMATNECGLATSVFQCIAFSLENNPTIAITSGGGNLGCQTNGFFPALDTENLVVSGIPACLAETPFLLWNADAYTGTGNWDPDAGLGTMSPNGTSPVAPITDPSLQAFLKNSQVVCLDGSSFNRNTQGWTASPATANNVDASADGAIEICFSPDSVNTDPQLIWEDGGLTHGWSMFIRNGILSLSVIGNASVQEIIDIDLASIGWSPGQYICASASFDRMIPNYTVTFAAQTSLGIGTSVTSTFGNNNPWAGSTPGGLGINNGSTGGLFVDGTFDGQPVIPFTGKVARLAAYSGTVKAAEPSVVITEQLSGDPCLYSLIRTFSITDPCCGSTDQASITFTWSETPDAPELVGQSLVDLGCIASTGQIPLPNSSQFSFNAACSASVQFVGDTAPQGTGLCGFEFVRTYQIVDNCNQSATFEQTIAYTIELQPEITGVEPGGHQGCQPCDWMPATNLDTVAVSFNTELEQQACGTFAEACDQARVSIWDDADPGADSMANSFLQLSPLASFGGRTGVGAVTASSTPDRFGEIVPVGFWDVLPNTSGQLCASADVWIPNTTALVAGQDNVNLIIRFRNSTLSTFADWVTFSVGANLSTLDTWQTISACFTIPTVDGAGNPIDEGYAFLSFVDNPTGTDFVAGDEVAYVDNLFADVPGAACPAVNTAMVTACSSLNAWSGIDITHEIPAGCSVTFELYDSANTVVASMVSVGPASSTSIDLSSVTNAETVLRLEASSACTSNDFSLSGWCAQFSCNSPSQSCGQYSPGCPVPNQAIWNDPDPADGNGASQSGGQVSIQPVASLAGHTDVGQAVAGASPVRWNEVFPVGYWTTLATNVGTVCASADVYLPSTTTMNYPGEDAAVLFIRYRNSGNPSGADWVNFLAPANYSTLDVWQSLSLCVAIPAVDGAGNPIDQVVTFVSFCDNPVGATYDLSPGDTMGFVDNLFAEGPSIDCAATNVGAIVACPDLLAWDAIELTHNIPTGCTVAFSVTNAAGTVVASLNVPGPSTSASIDLSGVSIADTQLGLVAEPDCLTDQSLSLDGYCTTYRCTDNTIGLPTVTDSVTTNGCEVEIVRTYRVEGCCDLFDRRDVTYTYTKIPDLMLGAVDKIDMGCITSTNLIHPPNITAINLMSAECGIASMDYLYTTNRFTDDIVGCPTGTLDYVYSVTDVCGSNVVATQSVCWTLNIAPEITSVELGIDWGCQPVDFVPPMDWAAFSAVNASGTGVVDTAVQITNCVATMTRIFSITNCCGSFDRWDVHHTWTLTPDALSVEALAPNYVGCLTHSNQIPQPNATIVDAMSECSVVDISFVSNSIPTNVSGCVEAFDRTYEITDLCGGTTTIVQNISYIIDDAAPTIVSVPTSGDFGCVPSDPRAIPGTNDVVVTDDNGTSNLNVFVVMEIREAFGCQIRVTRTWRAEDCCGKFDLKDEVYTFSPIPDISIQAPADINLGCLADVLQVPVAVPGSVTASAEIDAILCAFTNINNNGTNVITCAGERLSCPVAVTHLGDVVSNVGCFYTVLRTYQAENDCGSTTTAVQEITFTIDNDDPKFTALPGGYLGCDPVVVPNLLDGVVVSDVCGATFMLIGTNLSTNACTVTLTVDYMAMDGCENTEVAQTSFTWTETPSVPVISGHTNVAIGCVLSTNTIPQPNTLDLDVSVDCQLVALNHLEDSSHRPSAVGNFCQMEFDRAYYAEDLCGQFTTFTQLVTYTVQTVPQILTVSPATNFGCVVGSPSLPSPLDGLTYSGNIPLANVSVSDSTNRVGCDVTVTRSYRITECCGNFDEASTTFTWRETPGIPQLIGESEIVLGCIPNAGQVPQPSTSQFTPVAGCGSMVRLVSETSHNQVSNCDWVFDRVYEITDSCDQINNFVQTIRYSLEDSARIVSTEPDQDFGCQTGIPANLPPESVSVVVLGNAVQLSVTNTISTNGCQVTMIRTYTATDCCTFGDEAEVVFTWTETPVAPVITGVASVNLGCISSLGQLPQPSASQFNLSSTCGATIAYLGSSATTVVDCVSSFDRTYQATDICGQTTDFVQTISYTINAVPATIGLTEPDQDFGCVSAIPTLPTPWIQVTLYGTVLSQSVSETTTTNGCDRVIVRNYEISDCCGNLDRATVEFRYSIDSTPPVITAPVGWIPSQQIGCNPGLGNTPLVNPAQFSVTDDCGTLSAYHVSDVITTNGCAGELTRIYGASDACGNESSITQVIQFVTDTGSPVPSIVPEDLNLGCNPTIIPAASDSVVAVTDMCGSSISTNMTEQAITNFGCEVVITRTFEITDDCGNTANAQQTIRYTQDDTPPVMNCPPDIVLGCNPVIPGPDSTRPGAFDNCTVVSVEHVSDSTNLIGCIANVTRTYVATDLCGNTSSCSFVIHYTEDVTAPVLSCQGATLQADAQCTAVLPQVYTEPVTEVCGLLSVMQTPAPGTVLFGTGITAVEVIAIDACGNASTCSVDVVVEGTCAIAEIPSISLEKTVYLGHNGGADCAGSELVTAPLGSDVTYCFEITNDGQVDLINIELFDTLVSPILVTQVIASLPIGASTTVFIERQLDGALVNVASTIGEPVNGLPNVNDSDPAQVEPENVVAPAIAAIDLQKTVSKDGNCPGVEFVDGFQGDAIIYCFVVSNAGETALSNVMLKDDDIGLLHTFPGILPVGGSFTHSATSSIMAYLLNEAWTIGTPASVNGTSLGLADVEDHDTAEVNLGLASLEGVVWIDTNNDGDEDNENLNNLGIAGATVEVFSVIGGVTTLVGTATTDAAGFYQVTDLPAGDYLVQVVPASVPEELRPFNTTPLSYVETLAAGERGVEDDFGFIFQSTSIDLSAFDAQVTADGVTITWSPASETELLGFTIERNGEPVSGLILADGSDVYSFTDEGAIGGQFSLNAVDNDLSAEAVASGLPSLAAAPVGEPTATVVAEDGAVNFTAQADVASYFVLEFEAEPTVIDETNQRVLKGRVVEVDGSFGVYFSTEAGTKIRVE